MPGQTPAAPPRGRRILRGVALALGIPVGLVAVALGMVLVVANTGAGQREIERRLPGLTGGSVHLSGLGGRFPDALRVAHLELDDYKGAWLSIDGLQLDWSPLRLLGRRAVISNLSMARLSIPRLSEDDPAHPAKKTPDQTSNSIHMGIDIHAVHVARIDVGAALARVPASFRLEGHASLADIAPVLDSFSVATLPPADIALNLTRLDHPGTLALTTRLDRRTVALDLHAHEGADGFVATLGQIPALAPLDLSLSLDGPRNDTRLALALATGAVQASAKGQVGLVSHHMALDVAASSPAMVLDGATGWQGARLAAHMGGTLERPTGNGTLDVDRLTSNGAGFGALHLVADGLSGQGTGQPEHAAIHATITGLLVPGSQPTLFAADPVSLDVLWHPDDRGGPVDLLLTHPLARLTGQVLTAGPVAATFHADLPALAPLAAAGGTELHGHAAVDGNVTLPVAGQDGHFGLDSHIVLDGGLPVAVGLVGDAGHLNVAGSITPAVHGARTLTFTTLLAEGKTLHLEATPTRIVTGTPLAVDTTAHLALSDLHVLAPTLKGHMQADLHASGPVSDLAASLTTQASIAASNTAAGDVQASLDMQHLPQVRQGVLAISGTVDRAPVQVAARLDSNADTSRHLTVEHLSWKSLTGQADMTLPAGRLVPSGTLDLHMTRLADLRDLTGQDIGGHLSASLHSTSATADSPSALAVNVDSALAAPIARIDRLVLRGRVLDPVGATPTSDLDLMVDNAHFRDMSGHAHVTAKGPTSALNVTAQSGLDTPWTGPATLDTALVANLPASSVAMHRLVAEARREQVRLDAPVSVTYGKEIAIDHLRMSLIPPGGQSGSVEVAGKIRPTLDLHATLARLSPDLVTPFVPSLHAQGQLSAEARLSGTLDRPSGRISVNGTGLKYHTDYTSSLAPASLDATAVLTSGMARVDARMQAGTQVNLGVHGTTPVNGTGQITLQTEGNVDLAVANAYLGAQGMQAGGMLQMNLGVRGTPAQPRLGGTLTLANGLFHDFGEGIQLAAIHGTVNAMGDRLVISDLAAQAGKGSISASGSYGVLEPGQPIDLHVHADNARPLASDLITTTLDGDLGIKGQLASRIDATGAITLRRVDINIPDSLPTSVAHLDVIRPGDESAQAKAAHTSPLVVGLGLDVASPGRFYVRGHGLNTEMHGKIHAGGTATAPLVSGGFSLVKGGFSLGGISLDFSKGQVGFNGVGVTHKIDPTLDFVAERSTNDGTARLNVGGYASAPKITFSSTPPLSQDQILAILLFGTDTQSLSPTQMASIAAAVATLSGGSAFDPLGMVRKTLHLDRLQMSSSSNGSGGNDTGAIEAGKYVMRRVYVGAKQATSGSGTQAQVQVDLTKRLKLNTTVGTGGNVTGFTTPENDPGSSIGLLYQFRY
ncbi:translocation/assembly module TamB domain-containing protein [Komagataeibacter sp. FNDCF1]|uniref:translocation/assembly module TamB domain-containing protein n=1 Tax=Komagataeibacter sp. FNDCF1 TaxID=2878681 RepID=UPI001E387AEB|nr:translocation/assembly module TamB domain-containing protein [Komagataeibacter sp. FNDCF1]MCE2563957.1 translocation/assembly module TamB domain-containing protein [Komagataeibacter sp. FNDCF1]